MNSTEIAHDFTKICRCCMETASYDLFKTYFENEPLAKLLSICTSQRISKSDIYPKNICQPCLQSLIAAYIFKEKVVKTQQALGAIARIVDRAKSKKNGNVSRDHTYHHHEKQAQMIAQELDQNVEQGLPAVGHIKVEMNDEEYLSRMVQQELQGQDEVKYIKQNGDEGEQQEYWLQEVSEADGNNQFLVVDPNQAGENFEEVNNLLQNVKVINPMHFADGNAFVEGEGQEGAEYETIEFIDGDVNYINGSGIEHKQKDRIHVCRVCNEGFMTSRDLNAHAEAADHPQRVCTTCFESFHSYSALIKHCMETEHPRPPMFKCPFCFKKCDNKQILQSHVKNHMKTRNIRVTKDKKGNLGCQVCRTAFVTVSDLRQHYRDNIETHLTCHICLEKLKNVAKLEEHLKQHNNEKPFGCEICGARFNLQANFERHLKKHTESETLYKCQFCSKVFADESMAIEHEKLHENIHEIVEDSRNHLCTECGKVFTTAGFLKKHVERFHLGLNYNKAQRIPFECELCGKILSCKATLYSHLKNVHEKTQKLYTCEICGKVLKTKTSLELHTNYHNGNCPFKCGICGKAFTNATTLKSHSLIHTNERPHECQVCHKTFKQKPHLTTHILTIHTALKLFKCDYCEKTFALKGNLSQHLKTHTGCESPYVCSVCNKAFYFASRLRKHEKIHMKQ